MHPLKNDGNECANSTRLCRGMRILHVHAGVDFPACEVITRSGRPSLR
ncbi:hypothetical protein ADINL_1762 [Nitrincola lacisaponensis]|uniref:Uncharacterized protein n=1 Tax=Nitrincola lacisaponensis TaxID=267850 RepID=A0A063Y5B5_9GAMM|nr:hypothetical protein ADINL_1762 [Nitrincola lacisaponensis]